MRTLGRRILWCVLVAALPLTVAPDPGAAQAGANATTSSMLREAAGLEASGNLEGAERVLRDVLQRDPQAAGAVFSLERVLRRKGEPEAVLPVVADFLTRDPLRAEMRLLELRVLAEVDSLDALSRRADAWISDDPSAATFRELSALYEGVHGPSAALDMLERGRRESGDDALLAFEAGDLRLALGDRDGALLEWVVAVGDDGSGVAPLARRIRALDEGQEEAARAALEALSASPVFARRRAAAGLAVELRLADTALELIGNVSDELGGRARSTFLSEMADRARDLSVGAVATWAYDQLGSDARTPVERRAIDQRLVEASLAAGDTASASEALRRIARSYPRGSTDRRQATLRSLRLGRSTMDAETLRASFQDFLDEYPGAPELDEVAAAVAQALQARGDAEGALRVVEQVEGPRSATERGYLLLDEGRIEEARAILSHAFEGLAPSDATQTIRLMGLLGRLSPEAAAVLARAAATDRRGDVSGAVGLLEGAGSLPDTRERATLLAQAARMAEDSGAREEAARLRTALLEAYPDDPAVPEAALALARHLARQEGGVPAAIEILEELIASRPNAALAPSARAELARLRGRP